MAQTLDRPESIAHSRAMTTMEVAPSVARFRHLIAEKKLQLSNEKNCSSAQGGTDDDLVETSSHHDTSYDGGSRNVDNSISNEAANELETSTWAMVGNYLDESRIDEGHTFDETFVTAKFDFSGTPFKQRDRDEEMSDSGEWEEGKVHKLCSPVFGDMSINDGGDGNGSIGHLDDRFLSPVLKKSVKWASDTPKQTSNDDLVTPKNDVKTEFRKSPFVKGTPFIDLNESVVVSDDEASVEGAQEEVESRVVEENLFDDCSTQDENFLGDSVKNDDSPPSIRESLAFEEDSLETAQETDSSNKVGHTGELFENAPANFVLFAPAENFATLTTDRNDSSPTKAALNERVKFLATEVRFADQTCVELSTKLKSEKSKSSHFQHDLSQAKSDNERLVQQHQNVLQENAQLNALMQCQRQQTCHQLSDYKSQLATLKTEHQSDLLEWESRYNSHLQHSNSQIAALNERLAQSLQVNASLQSKLDKWDNKLLSHPDASSRVVSDLKERVVIAEASVSKSDSTVLAIQARLYDLQSMYDRKNDELLRERNECKMIEADRDEWMKRCDEFEKLLAQYQTGNDCITSKLWKDDISSTNGSESATPVLPTANLSHKTFDSKENGNDTFDNVKISQCQLDSSQSTISDLQIDYEELKAENEIMKEDLNDKCLLIEELRVTLNEKEEVIQERDETIEWLIEEIEGENEGSSYSSKLSSNRKSKRMSNGSCSLSISISKNGVGGTVDSSECSHSSLKLCTNQVSKEMSDGCFFTSSRNSTTELHNIVSDLEGHLKVTQEALESTEEELLVTRRKLAETKCSLEKSEVIADEMESRLETAEADLADAEEQILEYDEKLNRLTKELQENKDFSEFQARTIGTIKLDPSNNETRLREFSNQLRLSLQALMKVEKILQNYEDSDDQAKQKLSEQSRKIVRLENTIKAINDHLSARVVDTIRTQNSDALLGQSLISNVSSVAMETPFSAFSQNDYYQEKLSAKVRCFRNEVHHEEKEYSIEASYLRSQVDEILTEKEALVQKCQILEAKLSIMSIELSDQKAKSNALTIAQEKASHQMDVFIENNSEVLTENKNLQVDLQCLEIELQNVNALLKASNEERRGSQNDVKAAKAAFECLQAEFMLTNASMKKLQDEIGRLREVLSQKEKKLKELSNALEVNQELLACDRVKFNEAQLAIEIQHKEKIKALQSTNHKLELQITEVEQLRTSCYKSFQNATDRIKVLESMIVAKEQEVDLYKAECNDLNAHLQKKEDELLSIQNNRFGTEEELSEERSKGRKQRQEIEQLRSKAEENKLCMGAYEESVVNFKKEITGLQCKISDLQHNLDKTIANYQSIIHENERHIHMLQSACDNRQYLFDQQLANAKEERESTTADLNSMITIFRAKLNSNDKAANEQNLIEKDVKIKEYASIVYDLEEELEAQTEMQSQLEDEISRKQGQIETLQNGMSEANAEIASATEKIYSLEIANKELMESNDVVKRKLESSVIDVERIKRMHHNDQLSSNTLIKKLQNEVDSLDSKKKDTENFVRALEEELKMANKKLCIIEQQLEHSINTQTKKNQDNEELLAQNNILNKKCDLFKDKLKQLNSKLSNWEQSYSLQSKDIVDYGREISRLTAEKNRLKAELLSVDGSSERYISKRTRINQTVNTLDSVMQTHCPTTI